jgi:hypothetical protein
MVRIEFVHLSPERPLPPDAFARIAARVQRLEEMFRRMGGGA